jgi:hypothetical protein
MMCGNPAEMLDDALSMMDEAERARFESDYQHFKSYSGMPEGMDSPWTRWAYWSAGNYRVRKT